jgi:hypothetical protein
MNRNVTNLDKAQNKQDETEIPLPFPISAEKPMLFQIFFLSHNHNQDVEVLETEEIDCGEIVLHLKLGESVFIKCKDHVTFDSNLKIGKEEKKPWYFNCC